MHRVLPWCLLTAGYSPEAMVTVHTTPVENPGLGWLRAARP